MECDKCGTEMREWSGNHYYACECRGGTRAYEKGVAGRAPDTWLVIPENEVIPEHGYFNTDALVELLRDYCGNPEAVRFIADMMEGCR